MKLRIKGNSIRLRLTKSEVDYFANTLSIQEDTNFGNSNFTYALRTGNTDSLAASLENNSLLVTLPVSMALEWTKTSMVGCKGEIEIGNQKKLYILIEKDFKCLDDTIEDQSDNYENPSAHNH